jgi:hypothetical protein
MPNCATAPSLRYTDVFEDPNLPDAIPIEACYLGWQQSLCNLAKLVGPEING